MLVPIRINDVVIRYLPGKYGGQCRAPFTCKNGLSVEQLFTLSVDEAGRKPAGVSINVGGTSCKCPKAVSGSDCSTCAMSLDGPKCTLTTALLTSL